MTTKVIGHSNPFRMDFSVSVTDIIAYLSEARNPKAAGNCTLVGKKRIG